MGLLADYAIAATEKLEQDQGFKVIRPGRAKWLPRRDWHRDTVCSVDSERKEARLILLRAHAPGRGALTRTLAALAGEGLAPVVIEPLFHFRERLIAKGWRQGYRGKGNFLCKALTPPLQKEPGQGLDRP